MGKWFSFKLTEMIFKMASVVAILNDVGHLFLVEIFLCPPPMPTAKINPFSPTVSKKSMETNAKGAHFMTHDLLGLNMSQVSLEADLSVGHVLGPKHLFESSLSYLRGFASSLKLMT